VGWHCRWYVLAVEEKIRSGDGALYSINGQDDSLEPVRVLFLLVSFCRIFSFMKAMKRVNKAKASPDLTLQKATKESCPCGSRIYIFTLFWSVTTSI